MIRTTIQGPIVIDAEISRGGIATIRGIIGNELVFFVTGRVREIVGHDVWIESTCISSQAVARWLIENGATNPTKTGH